MLKARFAFGLALLVAVSLYLLPALQAAENPVPDSPEVAELLTQAQKQSVQLRDDAELMHSFSLSNLSWQSHAEQITTVKMHINNLGKTLKQMGERREFASPWQQQAIDRITPLASELASDVEKTIEHINNNQNRLHTPQYTDYLASNSEVADSLAALISDFVSYGKNKARFERLGTELEVSSR
ncbi:MAG: hypothetical protein P8Z30_16505 [Acidobacteriota bacterium]